MPEPGSSIETLRPIPLPSGTDSSAGNSSIPPNSLQTFIRLELDWRSRVSRSTVWPLPWRRKVVCSHLYSHWAIIKLMIDLFVPMFLSFPPKHCPRVVAPPGDSYSCPVYASVQKVIKKVCLFFMHTHFEIVWRAGSLCNVVSSGLNPRAGSMLVVSPE